MSDRTVTYTFRGNFTSLTAGLAASGRAVGDLGTKLTAADRKGAQYRRGLSSLGSTAGKAGLVAAAGIAVMVKATADFDQAMSNVNATGAVTIGQLGDLRQAALAAGQTTKFSATEAAGGIEALLKAGVSAADVMGGALKGSLALAAAGQLDVADAAEVAATAMTEFKLSGTDVPHIADLIAAGAGKAQGDVSDMAEALKAGGLTAAQFGVSLDDTVGTLTAFAAAGLLGSTGGTVLKQSLLKLAAPSVKAANTMAALGISAYDASGKFVGFAALAGQLQTQLGGLTQEQRNSALATIFGSRAIQGANVLYADGAAGIEDFNKKVNDQGYAAQVAAARLDNLSGDLHKFKSALDVAFIGQGEGSQGPLRNLVQGATAATNAFNKLPTSVHTSANALLTLTAITGGGLWFTTKAIGAVGSMNSALKNLGVSSEVTARGLKAAALSFAALEVAGQGLNALIQATRESLPGTQELTKELLALQTEVDTLSNKIGGAQLDSKFDDIGASLKRIGDPGTATAISDHAAAISNVATSIIGLHAEAGSLSDAKDEINALDAALANIASTGSAGQAQAAFTALAQSQGLSKDQQAELIKLMPQYREALDGISNTATLAAGGVTQLAAAAKSDADAQDAQFKAINKANQAMSDQRDKALSAFDAETQYRQAVKDATAQANKSNDGIKGNTDAALANRGALSGLTDAWNNQSAAVKNNVAKFNEARQNFITTAEAMGVPEAAAKALAKQLLDIPRSVVTKATVDDSQAIATLNGLQNFKLRDKFLTVHTVQGSPIGGDQTAHGAGTGADGTTVPKGGSYRDKHLYLLAPGEEVISNRHGQADQFRADRASGRIPGYAEGGTVGGKPPAQAHGVSINISPAEWAYFGDGVRYAAAGFHGLKAEIAAFGGALTKAKSAASGAADTLQSLKDQRTAAGASAASPFLHDAFGNGLAGLNAQVSADTNDATAMLAVLKDLVAKGLDPKSALFEQLAASGDLNTAQQLDALTKQGIASEAAAFGSRGAVTGQLGSFVGSSEFDSSIKNQTKVLDQLQATVHQLGQQNHELAQALKAFEAKAHKAVHDGAASGSEKGTHDGLTKREQSRSTRVKQMVRTGSS